MNSASERFNQNLFRKTQLLDFNLIQGGKSQSKTPLSTHSSSDLFSPSLCRPASGTGMHLSQAYVMFPAGRILRYEDP